MEFEVRYKSGSVQVCPADNIFELMDVLAALYVGTGYPEERIPISIITKEEVKIEVKEKQMEMAP